MDEISNAKIIQAMFGFLEAVHGKKDITAISSLIRGMIDTLMSSEKVAGQGIEKEKLSQWNRLDHDLRSPMNGILGFIGILLEECTDPEATWKLEQIRDSAQKLMQIFCEYRIYGFSRESYDAQLQKPDIKEKTEVEPPKPLVPPAKKIRSSLKKLPNVLIVEDNSVNSNLLMMHLKKRCHLFFSISGKAAVEIAKIEKIDAIFMDINLGEGIDGIQALKEIRKQVGNETLPIIAVTGFVGLEDKEKFIKAGFNYFIPKPFQRQEVIEVFEKIFPSTD